MHLSNTLWSALTYLTGWVSLSPDAGNLQQPLAIPVDLQGAHITVTDGGPDFKPPGGRLRYGGSDFRCEYPEMKGWQFCSTEGDRSCWLAHPDGRRFDTLTDYEKFAPVGIERRYNFEITDGVWNADGLNASDAKLVNKQYPGPWVQACWGDVSLTLAAQWMKLTDPTENYRQCYQQDET